jgi:benzodiazapine receptor
LLNIVPLLPGQLTAGFADLLALTGTVAAWGYTLKDVDELAAYLTIPYLAWLGYASSLNGYIWW